MGACNRSDGANKQRYQTRVEASYGKMRYFRLTGDKLKVYKCQSCGSYHIGHKPQWLIKKGLVKQEEDLVGKMIGALKLVLNKETP